MRARRTVCLLAAGIALPAMAGGPACRAELPPGLVATPVAEDVATAGMAMSITHVRGKEGVEALLRRAGQLWTERGYVASRGRVGTWEVLSGLGKDCLLTLQLAGDGGGSAGYLARSRKAGGMATLLAFAPWLEARGYRLVDISEDDTLRAVAVKAGFHAEFLALSGELGLYTREPDDVYRNDY